MLVIPLHKILKSKRITSLGRIESMDSIPNILHLRCPGEDVEQSVGYSTEKIRKEARSRYVCECVYT